LITNEYYVKNIGKFSIIFDKKNERTLLIKGPWSASIQKKYEVDGKLNELKNKDNISPMQTQLNLRTVVLQITEECNLRCKYCSRYKREYGPINMSSDVIHEALQKCISWSKQIGIPIVIQFHGGEPTLKLKTIKKVLDSFSESELDHLRLRIQTNGTKVDDLFINLCKKYKIQVGLSIDGPPEITNITRYNSGGINVSEQLESAMLRIKRELPGSSISCLCVISSTNVNRADEVFDYIIEKGIDDFSILPLYPDYYCIQDNRQMIPRDEEMYHFSKIIFDKWINRLKENNQLCIPNFQTWMWNLLAGNTNQCVMNTPCGMAQTLISIDTDGSIYPCGPLSYYSDTKLGNIMDISLNELIKTDKYLIFSNRSTQQVDECNKCAIQGICRGGCPANSILQNNDIFTKDPFCEYWEKIISHILLRIAEEPEILKLIPKYTLRV